MDPQVKEMETVNDEHTLKKGRHRKRQLYNSILQQMEFYFSDSNLSKSRFLSQLIEQDPYVDLDVFLKFNKIQKLTSNISDIQKAIKNSKLIELSDDKAKVHRKVPIKVKTNVDECTIYVERLKSDATHEWLISVFGEFGTVDYVSIPKYKHNNTIKGFAFIEFEKETEAQKALAYFESIGCKMPSITEPEQLCSITTFQGNENSMKKTEKGNSDKKRKIDEVDGEQLDNVKGGDENQGKRLKLQDKSAQNEAEDKEKTQKQEVGDNSETDETDAKKKKKLKKDNKKKNYIKELGLQVLSKKEWKKMRNRYLEMQRKKMQEFKKYLHKAKFSQANYEDKFKKSAEKPPEETLPKLEFIEGVIVKIKLPDPTTDLKKYKNELKASSPDIQYVDMTNPGSEDLFIRFNNSNSASNFCQQESTGQRVILTGDEEKTYWDKILNDRAKKFEKCNKKQRGRDKLLKKANKVIATHTKFDE